MSKLLKRSGWSALVLPCCLMLTSPTQAAGFDCAKAASKVEKLICADATLSAIDGELADIYRIATYKVDQQNERKIENIRQAQRRWLKVRNGCHDADCLKNAYLQRIHELTDTLAQTAHYRYQLKESHDKELCAHMTQVFNQSFRTPWYKSWLKLEPNPVLFGKPYDQIFARLPGVEFKTEFTWNMLLSKYPSTPEFEAVRWREGRVNYADGATPPVYRPTPMLVAEIDIDNDGEKDWVVKHFFMDKMTTYEGWEQAYGGDDSLMIFSFDGFDPMMSLTNTQLWGVCGILCKRDLTIATASCLQTG